MKEQGGEVGKGEWEGVGGVRGEVGGGRGGRGGRTTTCLPHNITEGVGYFRISVFFHPKKKVQSNQRVPNRLVPFSLNHLFV